MRKINSFSTKKISRVSDSNQKSLIINKIVKKTGATFVKIYHLKNDDYFFESYEKNKDELVDIGYCMSDTIIYDRFDNVRGFNILTYNVDDKNYDVYFEILYKNLSESYCKYHLSLIDKDSQIIISHEF